MLQPCMKTAVFSFAMDSHDRDRIRAYQRGAKKGDVWIMTRTIEVLVSTTTEKMNLGDKMRTNLLRAEFADTQQKPKVMGSKTIRSKETSYTR